MWNMKYFLSTDVDNSNEHAAINIMLLLVSNVFLKTHCHTQ